MLKMPKYHNPDPLVRLIGEANEAPAIVEGIPITSLVDSGACMSAMVKSFAKKLQLKIKPLKQYWILREQEVAQYHIMGM